jgi:hypothetical protein
MRNLWIGAALMGAALAVAPAWAATGLECMNEGYTAEQEKVFEDFYAGFTVASLDEEGGSEAQLDPIVTRAGDCAQIHGWAPDATTNAIFYRMSTMLAHALELKTPLTPEQMGRLNLALANADQTRLRAILGPQIEASMSGEEAPEMSERDEIYLGRVVLGAALPQEQATSEYAGALLGARMMAEIAAEKFEQS